MGTHKPAGSPCCMPTKPLLAPTRARTQSCFCRRLGKIWQIPRVQISQLQALNVVFEGEEQFSSSKGQFYEDNHNFAKGTTAKAQGTTTICVVAVGYFEQCNLGMHSGLKS